VRARRTRTGTRVWTRAGTRASSVMSVPFVIGPGRWRPGPGSVAGRVRPAHRAGGQGGTVRRRGRTPTLVGAAAARRGSSLCPMADDTAAAPCPWAPRRWPSALRRRTGAALVLALTGPLIAATVWARHHGGAEEGALWPDAAAGSAAWLLSPLLLWRPVAVAAALTALAAVSPAATPAATLAALQVAQQRPFPVAAAVGAAGIAAHAVQGLWRPPGGISFGWWLLLIAAGYAALTGWGALARARRALLMSLEER